MWKQLTDSGLQIAMHFVDFNKTDNDAMDAMIISSSRICIAIDILCNGTEDIIMTIQHSSDISWIFHDNIHAVIDEKFTDLLYETVRYDSDYTIAMRHSNNTFELLEAYMRTGDDVCIIHTGYWKPGDSLADILPKQYVFSLARRGNMTGMTLRVGMAPLDTQYTFSSLEEQTSHIPHNANAGFFQSLKNFLRFSMNLTIAKTEVGFNTISDLLQDGNDIVASVTAVHVLVANYVDFIQPLADLKCCVFFIQPPSTSIHNVFLLPLRREVWICLIACTVCVLLVLFITLQRDQSHHWEFSETILLVIGLLCQQGGNRLPENRSSRIAILTFLLPLLLLFNTYSGQVMSLFSSRDAPITSLQLLRKFNYKLFSDTYKYFLFYFTIVKDKEMEAFGIPQPLPTLEGTLKIREGRFAFFSAIYTVDKVIAKHFSSTDQCKVDYFYIRSAQIPLAMTVPKESEFKEVFNWGTIKLMETGIAAYMRKTFTKMEAPTTCSKGDVISLDLPGLGSAFIILMAGLISSLVLVILEWIVTIYKIKKETSIIISKFGRRRKRNFENVLKQEKKQTSKKTVTFEEDFISKVP